MKVSAIPIKQDLRFSLSNQSRSTLLLAENDVQFLAVRLRFSFF